MPEFTVERRNPAKLKKHPLNLRLYGDKPDDEFVALVRANGVTTPLQILPDDTVIEGHKRRQAAIICGIKAVPVIVRHEWKDTLLIERNLILGNKHREKTTEEKAREYERLKEIEAALAKRRLRTSSKSPEAPTQNSAEAPGKSGESRKIAADAVGLSHDTAEKAVEVVHVIDAAEAAGETEKAEELRETLNSSVAAAHRAAKPKPPKAESNGEAEVVVDHYKRAVPKHLLSQFEIVSELDSVRRALGRLKGDVKNLTDEAGAVELKGQWQTFEAAIKSAVSALHVSTPLTECPRCKGKPKKSCDLCKGRGFIVYGQKNHMNDFDRAWLGINE